MALRRLPAFAAKSRDRPGKVLDAVSADAILQNFREGPIHYPSAFGANRLKVADSETSDFVALISKDPALFVGSCFEWVHLSHQTVTSADRTDPQPHSRARPYLAK
jgi:hypothetical protein